MRDVYGGTWNICPTLFLTFLLSLQVTMSDFRIYLELYNFGKLALSKPTKKKLLNTRLAPPYVVPCVPRLIPTHPLLFCPALPIHQIIMPSLLRKSQRALRVHYQPNLCINGATLFTCKLMKHSLRESECSSRKRVIRKQLSTFKFQVGNNALCTTYLATSSI